MKILVNERLSEHKVKTPEGYLICMDAILARTGKQTYRKNEIFADSNDDSEIEVDRTADEVFSPQTLASFENKPVTVEHPDEDVNVHNHKDYAVGFVRDIRRGKVNGQDVMLGNLVITDEQAIKDVEDGTYPDLSCGYDCDIADEANPSQKNIRGNHVALCQQGRAGIARIVDSLNDTIQAWYNAMKSESGVSEHTMRETVTLDGRYAEKVWDDGVPVMKYWERSGSYKRRSITLNKGQKVLVERNAFIWVQMLGGWWCSEKLDATERTKFLDSVKDVTYFKTITYYRNKPKNKYLVKATSDVEAIRKVRAIEPDAENIMAFKESNTQQTEFEKHGKETRIDSVQDSLFLVSYVDRSDRAQHEEVEAKDCDEAIAKIKRMYRPYRVIGCRKLRDSMSSEVRQWWNEVEKWNSSSGSKYNIENDESDAEGMLVAMWDMLLELKTANRTLYEKGKRIYNKYSTLSKLRDVDPRKGESKDEFISRFMRETKSEYPDEKQRLAVAYSYWKGKDSMKDSKIKDFDDTPENINVVREFFKTHGNTFNVKKDAMQLLEYIYKKTGVRNADFGDVLYIIEEYTRVNVVDSTKDALVELPIEDKKYFEQLLKKYRIRIDGQGKTWSGRTHYQVSVTNLKIREFVKVLQTIDDLMDKRGIPMTYSASQMDEQDSGYCTAGIDLDKKYVKDSVKDVKKKTITELEEGDIIRDGTGARWLISVIRKGFGGQITLRVNGIDKQGSTTEWTFYSDHKTPFTVLDSLKDDINWQNVKNKVKADKWLQEHGLYDEFLAKGLYKKYTDYEYAKLKGMKDSKQHKVEKIVKAIQAATKKDSVKDSPQSEVFLDIKAKYPDVKFTNVEVKKNLNSWDGKVDIFKFDVQNFPTTYKPLQKFIQYILKQHGFYHVDVDYVSHINIVKVRGIRKSDV